MHNALHRELALLVGPEHVDLAAETLERHSRGTIPARTRCRAVVYPGSTQEVQGVVRFANEHRLAIWPFSKGKNWGYGTTMGAHPDGLVMILERMNRIHAVSEDLAYAVLEPGVTQEALNQHLTGSGSRLWTDCTDSTPEGSVLGNALERGVGYTPYGDHFAQLCGLEVVLPDGSLMRTGGVAEDCHTWNTYKWGTGPFVDGLFSQSNFGIVVKAGVWLMPKPEAFTFFALEMPGSAPPTEVLNAVRELALHRTISNVHFFNGFLRLTALTQYPFELRKGPRLDADQLRTLLEAHDVSPWTLVGGLYGTREQVQASRRFVQRHLKRHGRLRFIGHRALERLGRLVDTVQSPTASRGQRAWAKTLLGMAGQGASFATLRSIRNVYPILQGVPGSHIVSSAYFKNKEGRPAEDIDPVRDRCGITWFAPIIPATGNHVERIVNACQAVSEDAGFEFPLSLILLNPRTVIAAMPIYYDASDRNETERAEILYEALAATITRLGYQQYRATISHQNRILEQSPALRDFAQRLKTAIDPNNTIAPGRYGVGKTSAPTTAAAPTSTSGPLLHPHEHPEQTPGEAQPEHDPFY